MREVCLPCYVFSPFSHPPINQHLMLWSRLKTTLNLPKIEPRPPCPPRIYTKLYAYFDKTLTSSSASRRRARQSSSGGGKRVELQPENRNLPERHAPSKEKSFGAFRANRAPKPGLRYGGMSRDAGLPMWVGPAIRVLCRELSARRAAPHVYAGVESVMFLPCPRGGEKTMRGKTPALVAAVLFYVMIKMAGKATDTKEYNEQRKRVLSILLGLRENKEVLGTMKDSEESWQGWEVVNKKDVELWMLELSENGWLGMEWYDNLDDGGGVDGDVELWDEEDEGDGEIEISRKRKRDWGQDIGRGSMKQPQFDYLSEEKREAWATWKEAMIKRIDKLIANGILHDKMDTDEG